MKVATIYNEYGEDISKRTPWTKVLNTGTGHYHSVSFSEQIHCLDRKTNQYVSIDNTLICEKESLHNKNNTTMRVSLDPDEIVLEDKNGHKLSWWIDGAKPCVPIPVKLSTNQEYEKSTVIQLLSRTYTEQGASARKLREAAAEGIYKELRNLSSKAEYKEILPGVSLTCELNGCDIKETLIFSSPGSVVPVSFILNCGELVLKSADRSIYLLNQAGEIQYIIQKPVCVSATEQAKVMELTYKIEEKDAGTYLLTCALPEDWLATATFPIKLDPTVVTYNARCAIQDAYTCSKNPNTNYSGMSSNILRLTNNSSSWGNCECYFQFGPNVLPTLDSSDYITNATLYFTTAQAGYPTTAFDATVHEVTGSWAQNTLKYNNRPTASDSVLDYCHLSSNEGEGVTHTAIITNLVRKWYIGNNNGIKIRAESGTYAQLRSSASGNNALKRPIVVISYLSKAGLEDYLAYESHSVERAGTGYVSLFNGNLIFEHQDTTTLGNILPVSVSHVYNSCDQALDVLGYGRGWKLNLQQLIWKETINSLLYYTWMDADGTEVFFLEVDNVWKDQTGKELTLTFDSNYAYITSKNDTKWVFEKPSAELAGNYNNAGRLLQIRDALGHMLQVDWNGLHNTRFIDGVQRETTTNWSNGMLSRLNPPGDSTGISYTHVNGLLGSITYQDGTVSSYAYESGTGLLTAVHNANGLRAKYTYSNTEPYRVLSVKIYAMTALSLEKTLFYHTYEYRDCLTVVTDEISGKKIRYYFADNGNLISMSDELGFGSANTYTSTVPMNKPEAISILQRSSVNFLRDPFFTANIWILSSSGCSGSFSYDSNCRMFSLRSLCMNKTSNGGQMFAYQDMQLDAGKQYTLSTYCKTNGDIRLRLVISLNMSNAQQVWIDGPIEEESPDDFQRRSIVFSVPASGYAGTGRVYLEGVNGIGTLWLEGIQLEEGVTPGRLNLLSNPDFQSGLADWITDGAIPGGSIVSVNTVPDADTYPLGLCGNALKMTGNGTDQYRRQLQTVSVKGVQKDVYVVGGWCLSSTVPLRESTERCKIQVDFYDGSSWQAGGIAQWCEEWTGWKFTAAPLIAPCDYQQVRLILQYDQNYNDAYFCGIFLHREEFGQSYTYDSKGNIISTTNASTLKDYAEYDESNNLISYLQPGRSTGNETILYWGGTSAHWHRHLLWWKKSPMNIKTEYSYHDNGCVHISRLGEEANLFIQREDEYSLNGNDLTIKRDSRGKEMTLVTDANLGTLMSVTNPLGITTQYSYDVMKRRTLSSVTANGNQYRTQYSYHGDRLNCIRHNVDSNYAHDVRYMFTRDELGRIAQVKVGEFHTLYSLDYAASGMVLACIYGNNQRVDYDYDVFQRVTNIRYDGCQSARFNYTYGSRGIVSQISDTILQRVVRNEYDLANRPIRKTLLSVSGECLYDARLTYDTVNNPDVFRESIGNSATYITVFSWDIENKPITFWYSGNCGKITYTYDMLGRVNHCTNVTATEGGATVETTYTYLPGGFGSRSTTPLIQQIIQAGVTLSYAYDDTSRITSVTETEGNIQKQITYNYNSIGELIRVNDPSDPLATGGITWVYSYDLGGNMLSRTAHPYTTGTPGTPVKSYIYTYNTSDWRDQLTIINEQTAAGTITHALTWDTIGNLTNDGTWTYTWEHGKQLKQMTRTGETISFVYNEDGLRVRKSATSTGITEYTLHGTNIVHMTTQGDVMHFFYDAHNKPARVLYNGIPYTYLYNLQGDVIALVNSIGVKVVKYYYNAWGSSTSKTGPMASTLGTRQPFRYRGYIFDEETNLYYLESRYYDPNSGRFNSADTFIRGNMYLYCENQPITRLDPSGEDAYDIIEDLDLDAPILEQIQYNKEIILTQSNIINLKSKKSVTVSTLFSRFDTFIQDKINFRSESDSGCGMFIRAGILGKKGVHGSSVCSAGASSMFNSDMILTGNIIDVGGFSGLEVGMILGTKKKGTFTDNKYHVEHVGVYAGYHDLGNGYEPAVYSFNTTKNIPNLLPFSANDWFYYGWHKRIELDF